MYARTRLTAGGCYFFVQVLSKTAPRSACKFHFSTLSASASGLKKRRRSEEEKTRERSCRHLGDFEASEEETACRAEDTRRKLFPSLGDKATESQAILQAVRDASLRIAVRKIVLAVKVAAE